MSMDDMSRNQGSMTGQSAAGGQDVDRDETFRLISSAKVTGTDVRRTDGDRIGAIDHVMIDKKSGQVEYAVMSFGGFLGLGESRRPVPWDALHYNENLDAYELSISDDQLKTAPEYSDDGNFDWSDPDWNRNMRSHYGSGSRYGSGTTGL